MELYLARIQRFESILEEKSSSPKDINLAEFRELCFGGIPDKAGLRQTCWKILLGYLPPEKSLWKEVRHHQRKSYYSFIKELIVEPGNDFDEFENSYKSYDSNIVDPDERKEGARWRVYYQDNKILEQIDKDVRRTLPDFAFFQLPIPYSPLCPLSIDPSLRRKRASTSGIVSSSENRMQQEREQEQQPSLPLPLQQSNGTREHDGSYDKITVTPRGTRPQFRSTTPNMFKSRRMTVTLMSPRAVRRITKKQSLADLDLSFWQSSSMEHTSRPDNAPRGDTTPPASASPQMVHHAELQTTKAATPAALPVTPNDTKIVKDKMGIGTANAELSTPLNKPKLPSADLPKYLFSPIPTRRSLFKRVAHLNQNFGSREHQPQTIQASIAQESRWKSQQQHEGNEEGEGVYEDDGEEELQDLHWEAIERILFIYAKLNPGVGYVQGMNEILGPLYYLLANDPDEESRAHAEAESFWLFHLMMAHFRDHFVRSLDRDRLSGIGSTIARMNQRLRQHDPELWQNLEDKGIAPEYYSFRWLTVLCTQEFDVPDVWRIWDSILADTGGPGRDYDFLLDFCCAMVCHLKTELMSGDFADNVKLLQNYPPVDIQPILITASNIREYRQLDLWSRRENGQDGSRIAPMSGLGSQSQSNSNHNNGGSALDGMRRFFSVRSNLGELSDSGSVQSSPTANRLATIDGISASDRLDQCLEGPLNDSIFFHTNPHTSQCQCSSATITEPVPPIVVVPPLDEKHHPPKHISEQTQITNIGGYRRPIVSESISSNETSTQPQSSSRRWSTGTWAETFSNWKAKWNGGSQSSSRLPENLTVNEPSD